jgi:hypothetical protein
MAAICTPGTAQHTGNRALQEQGIAETSPCSPHQQTTFPAPESQQHSCPPARLQQTASADGHTDDDQRGAPGPALQPSLHCTSCPPTVSTDSCLDTDNSLAMHAIEHALGGLPQLPPALVAAAPQLSAKLLVISTRRNTHQWHQWIEHHPQLIGSKLAELSRPTEGPPPPPPPGISYRVATAAA